MRTIAAMFIAFLVFTPLGQEIALTAFLIVQETLTDAANMVGGVNAIFIFGFLGLLVAALGVVILQLAAAVCRSAVPLRLGRWLRGNT